MRPAQRRLRYPPPRTMVSPLGWTRLCLWSPALLKYPRGQVPPRVFTPFVGEARCPGRRLYPPLCADGGRRSPGVNSTSTWPASVLLQPVFCVLATGCLTCCSDGPQQLESLCHVSSYAVPRDEGPWTEVLEDAIPMLQMCSPAPQGRATQASRRCLSGQRDPPTREESIRLFEHKGRKLGAYGPW